MRSNAEKTGKQPATGKRSFMAWSDILLLILLVSGVIAIQFNRTAGLVILGLVLVIFIIGRVYLTYARKGRNDLNDSNDRNSNNNRDVHEIIEEDD